MTTLGSRLGLPSTRLLGPQTCRRMLLTSKILIVLAASIAFLTTQNLNAITLSLFLVVGQACIIIGVLLYVVAALSDFFSHHGVSQVYFEPGKIIFRQGTPGDFVYAIIEGQVEVVREEPGGTEQLLTRLGPGEYFGEMALISNAPRTATVRTLTAVDAVTIAQGDFAALYAYLPDLHQSVERVMKQRQASDAEGEEGHGHRPRQQET